MPYIDQSRRGLIDEGLADPKCAGELNYAITRLLLMYLANQGLGYQSINDAIGALEGSKMELYRRVVGNYEDSKIKMNGDVYEGGI